MQALVFGGGGQIGAAVAAGLARAGWQVTATTRQGRALPANLHALGVQVAPGEDRAALLGRDWDAVIDTLAFDAADAAALSARRGSYGALCVISTASVYADDRGRGFETDASLGWPQYPAEIGESQARVAAGPGYSGQKVAMEDALLVADLPLILLRPGAIHGPQARHPREWVVVKRLLDGRTYMPMKAAGQSVFQTTSTQSIMGLTLHLLGARKAGVFNVADPIALSAAEIAKTLAQAMRCDPLRIVDAKGAPGSVGHTPWSVPHPLRLSQTAALASGWAGPPPYERTLAPYLDYMTSHRGDWITAFPGFARYGHDPFDYAAEDAHFSARS